MSKLLSTEQREELAKFLLLMELDDQQILEILLAVKTTETAHLFLEKLAEVNYEATPEEVYQMSGEAVMETM